MPGQAGCGLLALGVHQLYPPLGSQSLRFLQFRVLTEIPQVRVSGDAPTKSPRIERHNPAFADTAASMISSVPTGLYADSRAGRSELRVRSGQGQTLS